MCNIFNIESIKVDIHNSMVLDIKDNITISKGDIIGVLGENGAGKTTLINVLLGVQNFKGIIESNIYNSEIGVQFQHNSYNPLMKVTELVQIVTKQKKFDEKIKEKIKQFDLEKILNKKIGDISGGEHQRLTLFLVLFLTPDIYFFDEPTTGLDFEKRSKLLEVIQKETKNKTVLLVTHYFEELSNWANKLLILNKGKLKFYGSLDELQKKCRHYSIIQVDKKIDKKNIEFNIKTMSMENNGKLAFIIENENQENHIKQKLFDLNIPFKLQPQNIYTLYSVLINNEN